MHDTVGDGLDSWAAELPKPIHRADCGGFMLRDRLRLFELVAPVIAHRDAGTPSDFLERTACKPPGIFRLPSVQVLELNQLKLQ